MDVAKSDSDEYVLQKVFLDKNLWKVSEIRFKSTSNQFQTSKFKDHLPPLKQNDCARKNFFRVRKCLRDLKKSAEKREKGEALYSRAGELKFVFGRF